MCSCLRILLFLTTCYFQAGNPQILHAKMRDQLEKVQLSQLERTAGSTFRNPAGSQIQVRKIEHDLKAELIDDAGMRGQLLVVQK